MGRGNRRQLIFEDKIDYQYFLQTSRYIHLNPVKARMVAYPEDYLWSSYQSFIGTNYSVLVTTDKILSYFKGNEHIRYRAFVEDAKTYYTHNIDIQKSMGEDELWLPW